MAMYTEQLNQEKLEEMRAIITTITATMVLPLYLLFWVTDLVYAPQYKWEFLGLRLLVIPMAVIVGFLVKKAQSVSAAEKIGLFYVFALTCIPNIMIYVIGDPLTPYYTGMVLVAIGGLGFFPWSAKYFIYVVLVTFGPYFLIVFSFRPDEKELVHLVVITFFMSGVIIILWVINMFREKLRIKEITPRLELNHEIEKRKEIENDLRAARDQALEASNAKSAFLANMSHELRTPLNAIIGYSELMQDDAYSEDKQTYIKDLKKIDAAGKTLLDLINSVLDISRIEAGQMTVCSEDFDLAAMISDVEFILKPLIEKNNNRLIINYPENIGLMRTDEAKLRQVLYNLGSNAAKFTHDGEITLSVQVATIGNQEWIRLDIRDTGIGMTGEQVAKVFKEFTQADSSTTRKYGGTGLGLAICKRFSIILGGDVFIQSEKNVGSTFTVLVPRFLNNVKEVVDLKELEKILQ